MLATVLLLTSVFSAPPAAANIEVVCVSNGKRESWTVDGHRSNRWVMTTLLAQSPVQSEHRWLMLRSMTKEAPSCYQGSAVENAWHEKKLGWLVALPIATGLRGKADIRYGVSTDPWKTVATYDTVRGQWLNGTEYSVTKQASSSPLWDTYTVKVDFKPQRAIRVVDEQSPEGSEAGHMMGREADLVANLQKGKGHRIVVQTREYHWKVLKGIHLEPAG